MKLDKELLRESQRAVADKTKEKMFLGVFCDMGFGKTVVGLTAIEELLNEKKINKVLIVSTLLVARDTWPEEFTLWEHAKKLSFETLIGSAKKRLEKSNGAENVHIINQENFVHLVKNKFQNWPYDFLIFDDVKGFKNAKIRNKSKSAICMLSKECALYMPEDNAKACAVLCDDFKVRPPSLSLFGATAKIRPKLKGLIQLTGTPSSKELLDLWPIVYSIDGGQRLGRTHNQYKNRFFVRAFNGFGYELRPGAERQIHNAIKDICLSVETEAVLPPLSEIKEPIKLGQSSENLYKQLEKEFIIHIEEAEVSALNAGVLVGKLLQVCGGAVYTDDQKNWVEMHDEKMKVLENIILKHKGEPVLVGYNFKHELTRLKKRFPEGADIRGISNAVDRWNNGEVPLMFAHPASAGHGLNLQKGPGRTLVWYGLNWSLDLNKQLNKRLHRPGQKRECFIYYLVAEGKADDLVMSSLHKKGITQAKLLEALKLKIKKSKKGLRCTM